MQNLLYKVFFVSMFFSQAFAKPYSENFFRYEEFRRSVNGKTK